MEIVGELLFAMAGAVLQEAVSDEAQASPVPAALGHLLMGSIAGALSLVLLRHRVTADSGVRGISLIVAPVLTGIALELLGRWWLRRGHVRMALFTFRGGFCFAFAMAAVRFAWFARVWTWF